LELALEGERLCKCGDFRSGVAFFEASIQAGTDDLKTLSAIYSQLGNAYFFLGDYPKAVNYHKHDLTLARYVAGSAFFSKAAKGFICEMRSVEAFFCFQNDGR